MLDLYALNEEGLKDLMQSWGQPAYRASQLHAWLYTHGAHSAADMSSLPKALRERLVSETEIGAFEQAAQQTSKDGTVKRVYKLRDGQLIETVLMPYGDGRRTACISSQAGCAMGCVFCATGQMGFARHLSPGEIFGQAAAFSAELRQRGERLSNVVLMGMGEPFHNYDAVVAAIRRIISDLGIGARHITVSTVGLAPAIRRFAGEGMQVTLAISLHAATDEARGKLLPVNRRWPLEDLMDACRHYGEVTRRRVTFEWALIEGTTDGQEQAVQLARLLKGIRCHVNLIPLNPTADYGGGPTGRKRAEAFVSTLAAKGVPATLRVRRGIDIDAGCGQLKSEVERKRRPKG